MATLADRPGFDGYPLWSPDSTRLHAWTADGITIFGLDGAVQATLADARRIRTVGPGPAIVGPRPTLGLGAGRPIGVGLGPAAADVSLRPARRRCDEVVSRGLLRTRSLGAADRWVAAAPRRPRTSDSSCSTRAFAGWDPDGVLGLGQCAVRSRRNDWLVYVADADGTDRTSIIRADQDPNAGQGVASDLVAAWRPASPTSGRVGTDRAVGLRLSGRVRWTSASWISRPASRGASLSWTGPRRSSDGPPQVTRCCSAGLMTTAASRCGASRSLADPRPCSSRARRPGPGSRLRCADPPLSSSAPRSRRSSRSRRRRWPRPTASSPGSAGRCRRSRSSGPACPSRRTAPRRRPVR